jgi:hypothetical protein
MKNNIITFCCCLFTIYLSAQTSYPFFNNMKGERKIVTDTVITRVAPSTGAAFDDTLYFGNTVEILMSVPYTEVRNNMVSPWLKVVYQKGKFKKIGFVSAIDVALNSKIVCKNYEFIWGVVANNKKDSFINNELVTKNNYECKLVVSKEVKKIAETKFNLSQEQGIDSFVVRVLTHSKLAKTLFTIEYNNYSLKDTTKEYYTHHFVLCQNNQFAELPVTHNYIVKPKIGFPISLITFKNKNTFLLRTEFLQIMPEHIVDIFKWQNCSYILSE